MSRLRRIPLVFHLLAAVAVGIVTGELMGPRAGDFLPFCLLYVKLLKVLATPLLFAAIVDAIATTRIRARMGGVLLLLSTMNALVAGMIALGMAHLVPIAKMVDLEAMRRLAASPVQEAPPSGFITAAQHALERVTVHNLLSVIAAALLLGIALRFFSAAAIGEKLVRADKWLLTLCTRILSVVIWFVPLAAFGVVASVIGRGGARLFVVLGAFVLLVGSGIFLQVFVYYGVLVKFLARRSPAHFFAKAATPLATALSTGSSLATLPVTLQTLEGDLAVTPESARLAACVGTNLNHDGIVLYEAAAALFVAHAFGVTLNLASQAKVLYVSVLAAVGIAGVPEAGFITLSLVIGAVGLPLAAVPLLLPVDWLLGRFRAMANVASDLTVATILNRFFSAPTSAEGVTHDGTRWSNAARDTVALQPYDPAWPERFHTEVAALEQVLPPGSITHIEHVGSTSIPGLSAKPIIDIDLKVTVPWSAVIAPIEALGYVHWDDSANRHLLFIKGMPPYGTGRTHHIHLFLDEAPYVAHRHFRDHLRAHPDDAKRYEVLKHSLASTHPNDREAYTDGKSAFVAEILAKAAR